MKLTLLGAAFALGAAWLTGSGPAEAKGCLKGALVGGVAGHYAGHHAVLGALGGCVVGHHMANEKQKNNAAAAAQNEHPAAQPNNQ